MKTVILAALSVVTLATSTADQRPAPPLNGAMSHFTLATPAVPAPAVTFQDPSGHATGFDAFHGKVALVNLWATWCQPCIKEMPTLAALKQARESADFTVVTISEDRGGAAVVQNFMARHDFALDQYTDPSGNVGNALDVRGIPTTFLIDRDGTVLGKLEGDTNWNGPDANALIDWAISHGKPTRKQPDIVPIGWRQSSGLGSSSPSSVSTR